MARHRGDHRGRTGPDHRGRFYRPPPPTGASLPLTISGRATHVPSVATVEHALAISFGSLDPGAGDAIVARAAAHVEAMAGAAAAVVRGPTSALLLAGGAAE